MNSTQIKEEKAKIEKELTKVKRQISELCKKARERFEVNPKVDKKCCQGYLANGQCKSRKITPKETAELRSTYFGTYHTVRGFKVDKNFCKSHNSRHTKPQKYSNLTTAQRLSLPNTNIALAVRFALGDLPQHRHELEQQLDQLNSKLADAFIHEFGITI